MNYNALTAKVLMGRSGLEWPCAVYPHGGKTAGHLYSHSNETRGGVGRRNDLGQGGSLYLTQPSAAQDDAER